MSSVCRSSAFVSLVYQAYQRKVLMGFCSRPWGFKENEPACWWEKVGHAPGRCAGRDHHPCLGQMWKLQLSTCLVMLSFPVLFVCLGQKSGVRAKQVYAWRVRKERKARRAYTGIAFTHCTKVQWESLNRVPQLWNLPLFVGLVFSKIRAAVILQGLRWAVYQG